MLRKRNLNLKIITGHTGWTDDFNFAFAHIDEVCNTLKRKPKVHDPKAPYDGFDESEDTEEVFSISYWITNNLEYLKNLLFGVK